MLEFLGIRLAISFFSALTLGIAHPWLVCWKEKWYADHTYIDGKQLRFEGSGSQLFVTWLLWLLPALGHEWKKATCTEPSACTRCGETKGTALGHKWKQVIETDYVETKVITYSQCTVCKEKENKERDNLMTLLSDDGRTFRIPPTEYFKRLNAIITTMGLDVECSFSDQGDELGIKIWENDMLSGMVFFYKDRKTQSPVSIQSTDKDKEAAFGAIQMVISRESAELDGLLTAFVAACEPVCTTDQDLAYEIAVGALAYLGEEVVYPDGSLVYLMNILEDFVVLNAAPPEI